MEKQILKISNENHLGDHVFNMIFFHAITQYIEDNNIEIDYACQKQFHNQVSEFIPSKNIKLVDYYCGINNGFHLWMGNSEFENNWYNRGTGNVGFDLDTILCNIYNEFLKKQNIPLTFEKLEYHDPNLLDRYNKITELYPGKYSDLDFIIANSHPCSGQYQLDVDKWNAVIRELNKTYKIVTTTKVDGVNCTTDDNLTVKDIAALSTRAKKIIAVNSGVVPGFFNTYTLENIEAIYYFENRTTYLHPKFIKSENIEDFLPMS